MGMISAEQQTVREEWNSLQEVWEETRQNWQDEVGEYFEKEFWRDVERQVPALLRAMEELDDILDHALYNTDG